ncbi:hypothetical protein AVEN_184912-1 [Araneus ventricosus]|uniref:Uncharacterized protein n=1 Tax=Araneus ventricosus TaxID=182803 RepID=A0A4Y2K3K5_ARAVE|nr:hypothetical protein AVEN_184912-1 [Araneus ventricosus]
MWTSLACRREIFKTATRSGAGCSSGSLIDCPFLAVKRDLGVLSAVGELNQLQIKLLVSLLKYSGDMALSFKEVWEIREYQKDTWGQVPHCNRNSADRTE